MSRLSDLYKAMETLRKEGLPVNEDLERKANELEEEIIKKRNSSSIKQDYRTGLTTSTEGTCIGR